MGVTGVEQSFLRGIVRRLVSVACALWIEGFFFGSDSFQCTEQYVPHRGDYGVLVDAYRGGWARVGGFGGCPPSLCFFQFSVGWVRWMR